LSQRSLLLKSEPRFRALASGLETARQSTLKSWLCEQSSLTRRLRRLCGPEFRVEVIGEAWRRPFPGEAALLAAPERTLVWTREVALLAGTRPLVLARSVMPRDMLQGRHAQLFGLGQRPLGEWLFTHRDLRRLVLEFAFVPSGDWRSGPGATTRFGAAAWGRRALYQVSRQRLLVCEFFLPELFRLEGEVHCVTG
jgi:chorismate--pyruvate lyase